MTENMESRIQCALTSMLNEVDKLHLRHLQAEMHQCAAKCCQDKEASVEFVHACIEVCSENLRKAQKIVQKEFVNLQQRFQGCVLTCNNEARDKMTKHPLEQQIRTYTSAFDTCVEKCIDSNIALIPFIMKKMKEILATSQPEPVPGRRR